MAYTRDRSRRLCSLHRLAVSLGYLDDRRVRANWAVHMNEGLSEEQRARIPSVMKRYNIDEIEAARRIHLDSMDGRIAQSEEDRRFAFERQKRDADIVAIHTALCDRQPYLDRCQ